MEDGEATKAHGLDNAIEHVLANCLKNPQAPGLLNALQRLADNRERHEAHEEWKAEMQAAKDARKAEKQAAKDARKAEKDASTSGHGKGHGGAGGHGEPPRRRFPGERPPLRPIRERRRAPCGRGPSPFRSPPRRSVGYPRQAQPRTVPCSTRGSWPQAASMERPLVSAHGDVHPRPLRDTSTNDGPAVAGEPTIG